MAPMIYLFAWILISKLSLDFSKENVRWAAIGLGALGLMLHWLITFPGVSLTAGLVFFIPPALVQTSLAYMFLWAMNRVSDSIIMALLIFVIGTAVQFVCYSGGWIWWIRLIGS